LEFLILLGLATASVWGLALLRFAGAVTIRPLPILGAAVVLSGCVVGYDFLHLDVGPIPLTIDRMLLLGMLAVLMYQVFTGQEQLRVLNRLDWAVLGLIVALTFSVVMHDWSYRNNLPISRLIFFYLFPLMLYVAMRFIKIGLLELKWIAVSMVILATYLALTAFAETREFQSLVFPRYINQPGEFYGRGRGPLLNPVINGMLMTLGCCCLWMGWTSRTPGAKYWIVGLTGLFATGVFLTYTRSVWLGFLASAVLFIFYPADRRTKGHLWLGGVLALMLAFPNVGDRLFSFKRDKEVSQTAMEQSARLRPIFVEVAMLMFQDRPLLGCGFAQYAREKHAYLKDAHSSQPLVATKGYLQHNVFLAYLAETGLVGFGFLVTMLTFMALEAWKLWRCQQQVALIRLYGLLMLAILLNYIINGMFHDVSIIPLSNTLLLFFAGIINNLASRDGAPSPVLSIKPQLVTDRAFCATQ
jgi:O-antigen ligase